MASTVTELLRRRFGRKKSDTPYQEIDYLQADGSAYINTNIGASVFNTNGNKIEWQGKFGYNTASSSRRFIASSSSSARNFYIEINTSNKITIGTSAIIDQALTLGNSYEGKLTIIVGASATVGLLVNGSYVTSSTSGYVTSINNIAFQLLRMNASLNGIGQFVGRNKIYVNDVLVRDFVPCRDGATGYMYDKVSGTLFGNAGSGAFVLGNDIN